jgi:hypothetical protein
LDEVKRLKEEKKHCQNKKTENIIEEETTKKTSRGNLQEGLRSL